jgi:predicted enzyme related to lactoylglutathione lyase
MPHVSSPVPGSFCWIELGTSDDAAAREFYTKLFGWSVVEEDMGEQGKYYRFQKDGRDAAAMHRETRRPPFWMTYIAVADADASASRCKELGGQIHHGPFDVMDLGRMAVAADPQGAMFCMWQAKSSPGLGIRDESNTLSWNELQARDLDAAKKFYPALFGWRVKESPDYTEWYRGDEALGGMLASHAPPEVPSFWMPYFAVDDCDASVAQVQSLGGAVYAPPMDIETVGRFAVVADPQGATFAVIKLDLEGHK